MAKSEHLDTKKIERSFVTGYVLKKRDSMKESLFKYHPIQIKAFWHFFRQYNNSGLNAPHFP